MLLSAKTISALLLPMWSCVEERDENLGVLLAAVLMALSILLEFGALLVAFL